MTRNQKQTSQTYRVMRPSTWRPTTAALQCRNAVSVAGRSAAAMALTNVTAAGSSAAAMLALINVTFTRNCISRDY